MGSYERRKISYIHIKGERVSKFMYMFLSEHRLGLHPRVFDERTVFHTKYFLFPHYWHTLPTTKEERKKEKKQSNYKQEIS